MNPPNLFLKKLGLAPTDRAVIIHADDIGMCQASLEAYAELADFGLVSCGAVMTPCAWFPAAAAYARTCPSADLGVHLTLTSEWNTYRWGPLSSRDPGTGLLDAEGYFFRTSEAVEASASPAAVEAEMRAQIDLALRAGIDVTHIDTHMGVVVAPKFIASYVQLGFQYRLPVMLPRLDAAGFAGLGMSAEMAGQAAQMMLQVEAMGMPLVDHLAMLDLAQADERMALTRQMLAGLPAGLTHLIIHPSKDTPELRAIAPDWRGRVGDYQNFLSEELRAYVRELGLQVIGYRQVRDALRDGN